MISLPRDGGNIEVAAHQIQVVAWQQNYLAGPTTSSLSDSHLRRECETRLRRHNDKQSDGTPARWQARNALARRVPPCTRARRNRRVETRRRSNAPPSRHLTTRPYLLLAGSGVLVMSAGGPVIDSRPSADLLIVTSAEGICRLGKFRRRRNVHHFRTAKARRDGALHVAGGSSSDRGGVGRWPCSGSYLVLARYLG